MLSVGAGIVGVGLPVTGKRQKLRPIDVCCAGQHRGNRKWLSKIRARLPVDKRSIIQWRIRAEKEQGIGGGGKAERGCSLEFGEAGAKTPPKSALPPITKDL